MVAQLDTAFLRIAPTRAASRLIGYSLFEGRPATTSGRWWNTVVFANLRLASGHMTAPRSRVDRPIFIVGMGRSGTTLLGRILAAHPCVGFLNEPKAMWHVIRDDEDIIGSYAQAGTGRLCLNADDVDPAVSRRAHSLFTWYLRASRSQRLVDKYPELVFRHRFVRAIFPDARFLVATRSPWSTLDSVARWSDSHSVEGADWWGVRDQKWDILWTQGVCENASNADVLALDLADERDHRVRAAVEWIVTMRAAALLARRDPLAHVISYDRVTREPRRTVSELLSFCELSRSARTEAYAETIVSASENEGHRGALASILSDPLLDLIDETWSQLGVVA